MGMRVLAALAQHIGFINVNDAGLGPVGNLVHPRHDVGVQQL